MVGRDMASRLLTMYVGLSPRNLELIQPELRRTVCTSAPGFISTTSLPMGNISPDWFWDRVHGHAAYYMPGTRRNTLLRWQMLSHGKKSGLDGPDCVQAAGLQRMRGGAVPRIHIEPVNLIVNVQRIYL